MYFLIVSGWNLKTSKNKPKLIRVRIKLHFKQLHRPLKKLFLKLSLKICPIDLFSILFPNVDHKRLIANIYLMVSMAHTNQTIFRTLHAPTLLPTISPILQLYFSIAFDFFLKFVHFSKFLLIMGKNVNRPSL